MKLKKEICPLSLSCNWQQRTRSKGYYCNNYRSCEDIATSWELPYYFDENGFMHVRAFGYRLRLKIDDNLHYYTAVHDFGEDCYRLADEWREFGWCAAEFIESS